MVADAQLGVITSFIALRDTKQQLGTPNDTISSSPWKHGLIVLIECIGHANRCLILHNAYLSWCKHSKITRLCRIINSSPSPLPPKSWTGSFHGFQWPGKAACCYWHALLPYCSFTVAPKPQACTRCLAVITIHRSWGNQIPNIMLLLGYTEFISCHPSP